MLCACVTPRLLFRVENSQRSGETNGLPCALIEFGTNCYSTETINRTNIATSHSHTNTYRGTQSAPVRMCICVGLSPVVALLSLNNAFCHFLYAKVIQNSNQVCIFSSFTYTHTHSDIHSHTHTPRHLGSPFRN